MVAFKDKLYNYYKSLYGENDVSNYRFSQLQEKSKKRKKKRT